MNDYIYASFLGVLRALAGLPFEHPFDYIKTQQQVSAESVRQVILRTHRQNGILKLYSGFLPNAARSCAKNGYRFPLMVGVPRVYRPFFEETTVQVISGISIALLESFIICPLERLKIMLMTRTKREPLKIHSVVQLYRGLEPVMLKQTVSWTTFLASNSYFTRLIKDLRGEAHLSVSSVLCVSGIVALINTAATLPIDCIKSRLQSFANQEASLRTTLKVLLAENPHWLARFRILYSGWQPRLCQFLVHAMLTSKMLERIGDT